MRGQARRQLIGGLLCSALAMLSLPAPQAFAQAVAAEAAPAYSATYGVRIPMRDGITLAADLYLPNDRSGPVPAVLVRTPYSKNRTPPIIVDIFASKGYAVLVEDKRGRFESEGEYIISDHEIRDSYDSIDWLSKQPWSSGKVGAYGCSDPGDAAIYAAATGHPALKAVIPEAAAGAMGTVGDLYGFFSGRNGGAVELAMGVGWMVDNGTKYFLRPPAGMSAAEFAKLSQRYKIDLTPPEIDYDKLLAQLPIVDIVKSQGIEHTDWEELAGSELTGDFFKQRDFFTGAEKIHVPALHVNSWYDFAPGVTLFQRDFFTRAASTDAARNNQFAVISPTLHCHSLRMSDNYKVGDRPMGDPRFPLADLYVKWFDHWLKGADNGVTAMPEIQYYLMGKNEWRTAAKWPAPDAKPLTLYLGGAKPANGPAASGVLAETRDRNWLARDRFRYDPAKPVPSIGGSLCCIRSDKLEGAYDQRDAEKRADVLTYSTGALKTGLTVAGPVEVVLYVSSSAPDTDFTAKLVDVYPDGTAYNLGEGILRARYRDGFDKQVMMKPGKVYELKIKIQDTANYFAPGHQLRVEVSSSNFPRFDRNLNTGGRNAFETQWRVADNVVHRSKAHASHIKLYTIDNAKPE